MRKSLKGRGGHPPSYDGFIKAVSPTALWVGFFLHLAIGNWHLAFRHPRLLPTADPFSFPARLNLIGQVLTANG